MTAEIISVGTEILLGNIVNSNAAYLAEQCANLGLSCYYQTVVGDNEERLKMVLEQAKKRSDIILVSGGMGPTPDDLTKETAAKVMGRRLILDEKVRDGILTYFKKKGAEPTENHYKQALIPEGGKALMNQNGTAPGVIMEEGQCHMILLPGPPNELEPMFEEAVVPYLSSLGEQTIQSVVVKVCGVGEGKVATIIQDMIERQQNPTIATYAKFGEVHIRVTAKAENSKEAMKLIKPVVKELKLRLSSSIYTTEPLISLEKAVVDLLIANKLTVTLAESCSGGLLAAKLVNVPGASEVFKSSFVTYSNKAKRKLLGVKKGTLEKYGAVSRQTAQEMAQGLMHMAKCDVAVGITGIAGPDGGTEEKPVGLVYISCCVKGEMTVKEYHFSGDRNTIRNATVSAALVLMRQCILGYYSEITFGKK